MTQGNASHPAGPIVSVIMNGLNCEEFVAEALDSVVAQTFDSWEVVFWDNASTDGTSEIVRGYGDRVRYFRGAETVPLGKARNLALAKARGEFIAFLDTDDLWMPGKLEAQLPLFRNEKVGIVFSDTVFFMPDGRETRFFDSVSPHRGRVFRELLRGYFLSLETVVVRRRALEDLESWFDPRFNLIEEADLLRRVAYNWEVDYVDEPLARYRRHPGNLSVTARNSWPGETEMMLDKFSRILPDFEVNFEAEIRRVKGLVAYHRARQALLSGDGRAARKAVMPLLVSDLRFLLAFGLSFFPSTVAAMVFDRRWRHRSG